MKRALPIICLLLLSVSAVIKRDSLQRLYYGVNYIEEIRAQAAANNLDPYLIAAVIHSESGFDPDAVSEVGASGLMQLMPETAKEVAEAEEISDFTSERLFEPNLNIRLGARYLGSMMRRFDSPEDALAAYNAGPGLVEEWRSSHRDIPYPETKSYINKVIKTQETFKRLYPNWDDDNFHKDS